MSNPVPEGWSSGRFDQFAVLQRGYDLPVQDRVHGEFPILGSNGVVGYHNEVRVNAPGVVTGRSGSIGQVWYLDSDFWALNTSLYVKNFHGNDSKYVYYFLQLFDLGKYGTGTGVPTLNRNDVHLVPVVFPPLPEQQKIAAILTSVDNVIESTSAQINKLQDLKTGMMQELLTRGIGHSEFKDSPVGRIPVGWEVTTVGKVLSVVESGWSPQCDKEAAYPGQWGVLKTTAVTWKGFDASENKRLPEDLSPRPSIQVTKDDVLITRAGPVERVGVIAHVDDVPPRLMLSDKVIRMKVRECCSPKFLSVWLSGGQAQHYFDVRKTGLAQSQANISQDILKSTPIVLPPVQEQRMICESISAVETKYASSMVRLNQQKALKKALMQDLLTGKVRVKTD